MTGGAKVFYGSKNIRRRKVGFEPRPSESDAFTWRKGVNHSATRALSSYLHQSNLFEQQQILFRSESNQSSESKQSKSQRNA